jgi:hypothetical protein
MKLWLVKGLVAHCSNPKSLWKNILGRQGGGEDDLQVELLITNNAFCIVQRATAQSKTGKFS